MQIEYEDIMMELVKTLGENNKVLLSRISDIERNGATKSDQTAILSMLKDHIEATEILADRVSDSMETVDSTKLVVDKILEYKTPCVAACSLQGTLLTKWDKLWSSMFGIKGAATLIIGVVCAIVGFVWSILQIIDWIPKFVGIFK
jgi:hypothetical protein